MNNENSKNNEAVTMTDERESWSMWDPAIPEDMYRDYTK
jgi:hypothetical protein